MAVYAVVNLQSNVVENIIEWDGKTTWEPPEGCTTIESSAGKIGDIYDFKEGNFVSKQ